MPAVRGVPLRHGRSKVGSALFAAALHLRLSASQQNPMVCVHMWFCPLQQAPGRRRGAQLQPTFSPVQPCM